MLARQKPATFLTATLNEAKQKGPWTDENRRELAAVRDSEKEIGRIADRASDAVIRDGSTIAFTGVLTDLKKALADVVSLIEQEETGLRTQTAQREIENMIGALIVATEENRLMLVAVKGAVQTPITPSWPPPLIPLTTELRLLKWQQDCINQRTAAIQNEFQATGRLEQKADLPQLSERQRRIQEMTTDVIKKLRDATRSDQRHPEVLL